jgi:oligopeptide/dipeptide ABC transporter ATP-binding protein
MTENAVIEAKNLTKHFQLSKGFTESLFSRKKSLVRAVDGINFEIREREIFGLAGESGSGKTTTGRLVLRLEVPTSGKLIFKGQDLAKIKDRELKPLRRKMQIVFQDPYESLNPRMTVSDILAEPLTVQRMDHSKAEMGEKIRKMLESVEITPPEEFLLRYPHELSGGQRQRVAVARAFILDPEFIVADEPVSMLDVSIRAEILNLMLDLVEKFNVSFLYITHDIALARHMCDRMAVMYLGKIVEMGPTEKIVYEPLHPYTNALIDAVPTPDPTAKRTKGVLQGEIPSPINPPSGCRFHTRCPVVMEICSKEEPAIVEIEGEHFVACHRHK